MKKPLAIATLLLSISISGCFGSGDSDIDKAPSEKFHIYSTGEISLNIPNEWEVLTSNNFTSSVPPNTVLAFRNNVKNPKFTANVAIIKNPIPLPAATTDYAKLLYEKTSRELKSFSLLQQENIQITIDGKPTDTLFSYFEGRETAQADLKKFMQISAVKDKTAYVALGAFLADDNSGTANVIATMVRSFAVK